MSFTCGKHGWRHLISDCPACDSFGISSGNAVTVPTNKLKEMQDEMAAHNHLPQVLAEIRRLQIELKEWQQQAATSGEVIHRLSGRIINNSSNTLKAPGDTTPPGA